jgi:hypothetical protein
VLQVLADPAHPDLPAKLRVAASAITTHKHRDLPRWLQGGLLTHLLNILRAIPTSHLDPSEAADICAAAAAALCNIAFRARCGDPAHLGGTTKHQVAAQVASPDVLSAVVQYGMLGPAAQQPLLLGREVPHIERMPTYFTHGLGHVGAAASQAARRSKQLWTPLRLCGFLIAEVMLLLNRHFREGAPAAVRGVDAVVGQLARVGVFRHLLLTALEYPAGGKNVFKRGSAVGDGSLSHRFL